jgi:hypothetical protein
MPLALFFLVSLINSSNVIHQLVLNKHRITPLANLFEL